jgi:hypothetical protein
LGEKLYTQILKGHKVVHKLFLPEVDVMITNFRRCLPIFGETIGGFLKNRCSDKIFAKTISISSEKRQFFSQFISENICKIITSVQGTKNIDEAQSCELAPAMLAAFIRAL